MSVLCVVVTVLCVVVSCEWIVWLTLHLRRVITCTQECVHTHLQTNTYLLRSGAGFKKCTYDIVAGDNSSKASNVVKLR